MPSAKVSFILPDPALRGIISTYYFVEAPKGEPAVHDLLHPEWANIRIALDGEWNLGGDLSDCRTDPVLYGPTSRAIPISAEGGAGLGIGVLPSGWVGLIDAPASDFADRVTPLTEVLGEGATKVVRDTRLCTDHETRALKLDAYFLAYLAPRPPVSPVVAKAHGVLMSPDIATVEQFADALGLSTRQAHRLSLRMFGFPPKLLLQRQRFLRTLAVLRLNLNRPWADLIDARYYDQSHLVRDFHRFMGMSPSEYFALPRDMLEPAAIARTVGVGQPLQGLQPPAALTSDLSKSTPSPVS